MLMLLTSLMLVLTAGATIYFQSLLSHSISRGVVRFSRMGLLLLGFCCGLVSSCEALISSALDTSNLYPIVTQVISDDYFFTQQEFGLVTLSTQGYKLTFYQNRPFWRAKELGSVQLVCKGRETISVAVKPDFDLHNRLFIKVDDVLVIDTTLSFKQDFYFRHTVYH